jgi:hypothetical protein
MQTDGGGLYEVSFFYSIDPWNCDIAVEVFEESLR